MLSVRGASTISGGFHMKFQRKKVATTIAMLAGGTLSALAMAPAIAQTPAQPAGTMKVEVTGTNIRRVDSETASPVQVITQEEMVRQGYTTINEVVREITANGQGLLSQGFTGAFASGGSGVALRGLGVGATLVLIDGLRMSPFPRPDDNQHNFVDISGIPFSAVERIEVLLDGASAIYGSDAIGGVLNVILKKSFTGTGTRRRWRLVDGGWRHHVARVDHAGIRRQVEGQRQRLHRLRVSPPGQDHDQSTVRRWISQDFRSSRRRWLKLHARRPEPASSSNPLLAEYALSAASRCQATNDPANNIFLNNNCNLAARNANQCTFQDTWSTLLPETENINVIARGAIRFANWELVLTGSWFRTEARTQPDGRPPFPTRALPATRPSASTSRHTSRRPSSTTRCRRTTPAIPSACPRTFGRSFPMSSLVRTMSRRIKPGWWLSSPVRALDSTGTSRPDIQPWTGWVQNGYINPYAMYAALNDPVNPFRLTGGNSSDVMGRVAPQVTNGSEQRAGLPAVRRDARPHEAGRRAARHGRGRRRGVSQPERGYGGAVPERHRDGPLPRLHVQATRRTPTSMSSSWRRS